MYLYVLGIRRTRLGKKELANEAISECGNVGESTPEFHLIMGRLNLQHQEMTRHLRNCVRQRRAQPYFAVFVHF